MADNLNKDILFQNLRAGEWVEVRRTEEILATLDKKGCLDNLPFMPEMLQYCGRQYRVYKRADKICDTITDGKKCSRGMQRTVFLENLRCDGDAHGGCDATCLLFWKEAWLKRVDMVNTPQGTSGKPGNDEMSGREGIAKCTVKDLREAAGPASGTDGQSQVYRCQATELQRATTPLPWWDVRQYWRDLASGNVGMAELARVLSTGMLNYLHGKWKGSRRYPYMDTRLLLDSKTPHEIQDLQPGDIVRVKNIEEILKTLNRDWKNRGLYYDETGEMLKYCNKKFKVLKRVRKIINERTGEMTSLKNDNVILEGVVCCGHYSPNRLLCPRSIPPFWREIWLEKPAPDH